MTANDLIEELAKLPPDTRILVRRIVKGKQSNLIDEQHIHHVEGHILVCAERAEAKF